MTTDRRRHLKNKVNKLLSSVFIIVICASYLSAQQPPSAPFRMMPAVQAVLNHISADSLRGHLSFIASDALEGRNTPSRGLDIAAEYIAAQFRRAGLEPVGDDGYFQTANLAMAQRSLDDFDLKIHSGSDTLSVNANQVTLTGETALALADAPIVKLDYKDAAAIAALTPEQMTGKVVITEIPNFRREEPTKRMEMYRAQQEFMGRMNTLKVALVVSLDRANSSGQGAGPGRLIDPNNRRTMAAAQGPAMITIHDPHVIAFYDAMKPGATATMALKLQAAAEKPVKVRNVIGLLRGSDPVLKDTYVMVTAHYDHLGMQAGTGDLIYNGANDDGSGTVSVVELAGALASMKIHPKRSIVFMTFFGEEKGLLGSRYYGAHPIFPIEKTVADVNLEQVGRTDSDEGPQLNNASMTGFDFSDVGTIFQKAGELTGIKVYRHERNSDAFFGRSDNQALADQGVPAHTLCVAYVYPDYHGLGDHWDKVDYDNMAKVDRCVALGLLMIADSAREPHWNEANPKTARYVQAWKALHEKSSAQHQ